ncbi:MAG: class I SAM-dependent methyltransferase [Acidobacteria bacterium]|jgi:2-polyprenyl-3-methyl-5-hydroxy-6-metoxy-1,4-benzoquinol methylase|nr:class I SAM-dependent methyltransferase [Acidobacteriota bacterium]
MNRQHYSYTHYADKDVAAGFDSLRFSGPIGEFLLRTQERLLLSAFSPLGSGTSERPLESCSILDVGTGTGRAAIGLARAGASVVGVDASAQMLEVARQRALASDVSVTFDVGDAHALPFPANHFDATVSLRVLMHTPDWRRCVGELCRVARTRVVVDFPSKSGFAALESLARNLKRAMGGNVEAYRVMSERSVVAAFEEHGYRIVSIHRQFVLPIALHKRMGSLLLTKIVERVLAGVGLLWLLGSPVTMVAER